MTFTYKAAKSFRSKTTSLREKRNFFLTLDYNATIICMCFVSRKIILDKYSWMRGTMYFLPSKNAYQVHISQRARRNGKNKEEDEFLQPYAFVAC